MPNADIYTLDTIITALSISLYYFLYQPILEMSGGTWGKKLIGLRTINLKTGKSPSIEYSYTRSIIRLLSTILLIIPFIISCLSVLSTKYRQTWHDSLTNTAVIKN